MTFVVAKECVELGLRSSAVVFRNVRVGDRPAELHAEIAAAAAQLRARFPNPASLRASWQVQAFQNLLRRAGASPRKFQPSLERLWAYVLKRGDLPAINNLVDAYNLVSIRAGCSLGAHDLDRLALPVALRLVTGAETFTPLGQPAPQPVQPGEFAYVDAANRILCRLDVLQADFSKVNPASSNVLLIVEGTDSHSPELLSRTMDDVIQVVTRYCQATAERIHARD